MDLPKLFSTRERVKILGFLLEHPSAKINMNKLARDLKLSPGQIHKYITILRQEKIVVDDQLKESYVTYSLRRLWNIKKIQDADIPKIARRYFPKFKGLGIFGSWAKGDNKEESDLDIWLKLDFEPTDLEVAEAKKAMEKSIRANLDIVIASPKRLKHLHETSDIFYFSLYNGITVWGEEL